MATIGFLQLATNLISSYQPRRSLKMDPAALEKMYVLRTALIQRTVLDQQSQSNNSQHPHQPKKLPFPVSSRRNSKRNLRTLVRRLQYWNRKRMYPRTGLHQQGTMHLTRLPWTRHHRHGFSLQIHILSPKNARASILRAEVCGVHAYMQANLRGGGLVRFPV